MLCNGNFSEYCGGGGHLDVYDFNQAVALPPWTTISSSSTTSKVSSISSSKSSSSSSSTTSSTSKSSTSSSSSKPPPASSTAISSISSSASAAPTLSHKQVVGPYTFQGCFTEATNVRALSGAAYYDYTAMTIEECQADCTGYTYFGVQYGGECVYPYSTLMHSKLNKS